FFRTQDLWMGVSAPASKQCCESRVDTCNNVSEGIQSSFALQDWIQGFLFGHADRTQIEDASLHPQWVAVWTFGALDVLPVVYHATKEAVADDDTFSV